MPLQTQPAAGFALAIVPEAWHARQSISSETGSTMSFVAMGVVPFLAMSRIIG
jgi:hypothetical protein